MPLFNPAALRSLRQLNVGALDSRATIAAPSTTSSPGGGANTGKRTWTDVEDDVPCRLSTTEGAPVVITAGQLATPDRMLAVFDLEGPAIVQGNRLTITGTDLAGQDWTRVVVVLSPHNPRTNSAMRVFVVQDVAPGGG